jgi:arabinofuranosyltransferase
MAASVLILLLASLWMAGFTNDDAFISFRYAKNLATGYGLVFNRGERVEGYTNFLWVLLLAGAWKISSNLVLVSKTVGIFSNCLTLLCSYHLCRMLRTKTGPLHGLALVLIGGSTAFVRSGFDGLETPLFTMLLCGGVLAYLKGLRASTAKKGEGWLAGSSLIFALLVLTRPDGGLAYGLTWLHAAWRFRSCQKNLVIFSLPMLLLFLPYFAWRWHYYGFILPNTYYAKGPGSIALYAHGAARIRNFLGKETGGILIASAVGLSILLFPTLETTVIGLAAGSRLIFTFWSGGVTAGYFHFLVPALPLIWILIEWVLYAWMQAAQQGTRGSFLLVSLFGLLFAGQVLDFVHYRSQYIEPERVGLEHAHISLGCWLKANSPPGATVAVGDIGAIGYFSGLRVLDLDGLVDTHIAHLPGTFGTKTDPHYVLAQSPDFIVLRVRRCQPDPADVFLPADSAIFLEPGFQQNYQRQSCWDFFPTYHLLVYGRNKLF